MGQYKEYLKYYNGYKDKIYTYVYYRVGSSKVVAEDLTSEIFLKALKNFESFDTDKSFQAWIYKIAKNHIINYYEKKKDVSLDEARTKTKDYTEQISDKYAVEMVMKEIKNLKDSYREVLLLRFVNELTNEEIAHVLDEDHGAIRTRISRALSALRKRTKIYD